MKRVFGSNVTVWKAAEKDSFNVKLETLDLLLTVNKSTQPKSFAKLEALFDNEEAALSVINFSFND